MEQKSQKQEKKRKKREGHKCSKLELQKEPWVQINMQVQKGWSTFEARIDQAKINYRIRFEHRDNKSWAKK